MKRILILLVVMGVVLGTVYGAAAALGVSGGVIQSGTDTDLTCDDAVVVQGWGYERDTDAVSNVRIGGIAAACEGCSIAVRLFGSTNNLLTTGWHESITADEVHGGDPGHVHVGLAANQVPADIYSLQVVIEGAD